MRGRSITIGKHPLQWEHRIRVKQMSRDLAADVDNILAAIGTAEEHLRQALEAYPEGNVADALYEARTKIYRTKPLMQDAKRIFASILINPGAGK